MIQDAIATPEVRLLSAPANVKARQQLNTALGLARPGGKRHD